MLLVLSLAVFFAYLEPLTSVVGSCWLLKAVDGHVVWMTVQLRARVIVNSVHLCVS